MSGNTARTEMDAQDLAVALVERARKAGADAADAVVFESDSLSASCRLGKLEEVERVEARDLGLRVFIGTRQASVSSNDWTEAAIGPLVERAVAMARVTPEDPYCGLAETRLLAKDWPDLDLDDGIAPDSERLRGLAQSAEKAALDAGGISNSDGASASWGRGAVYLATSEGFSGTYASSNHSISCSVLAGEGLEMERDYEFTAARHEQDLRSAEWVGQEAASRVLRRLGPRSVRTQSVPIMFDPRVSNSLLGHFIGAVNGAAIARGTSFLKDELGKAVFPESVSVIDDPHRKRGLRSKPYDGEGVRNTRRALVENGRLTTWILDTASAKQLQLESTGHAVRGTAGPPSPGATNLYLEPGPLDPASLMADIAEGFYVTELIGMGVNGVTGDYSRGAAGFWIENGQITYPVNEVTIAGNLKDMFRQMTPANDLEFRFGVNAPTVRIEGMTVAGSVS